MIKEIVKKKWEDFISQYSKYFLDNEQMWMDKLNKVKEYIDTNKKKPSSKKEEKNMYHWLYQQSTNYKNNKHSMKEENIKKKWEDFIQDDKYKQYFK